MKTADVVPLYKGKSPLETTNLHTHLSFAYNLENIKETSIQENIYLFK